MWSGLWLDAPHVKKAKWPLNPHGLYIPLRLLLFFGLIFLWTLFWVSRTKRGRDSEIFYLMSRGISYSEAIHLLIKGFIFSNLIVDMEKRAMIFSIIQNLRGE